MVVYRKVTEGRYILWIFLMSMVTFLRKLNKIPSGLMENTLRLQWFFQKRMQLFIKYVFCYACIFE